jgi:hypothetical protein
MFLEFTRQQFERQPFHITAHGELSRNADLIAKDLDE